MPSLKNNSPVSCNLLESPPSVDVVSVGFETPFLGVVGVVGVVVVVVVVVVVLVCTPHVGGGDREVSFVGVGVDSLSRNGTPF